MRRVASALLFAAAAACGCRSHSCELVESQLHAREADVQLLRGELDRAHAINHDLQAQLLAARAGPPAYPPGEPCPPAAAAYPVHTLTLGRQTGGYDADGCPGDEALQVVLEPRDADNQTVKVPGTAVVQALEVTPEGIKKPLSTWEVSEDDLRRSWRSGLLSTGYALVLPWRMWPSTEKLRVVVQLRTADGRLFEADKDVSVRLAPGAPPPAPPPAAPPGPPTLPPPRPDDPAPAGPVLDPASLEKPVRMDPAACKADWTAPASTADRR
jgi:hypothetical protein